MARLDGECLAPLFELGGRLLAELGREVPLGVDRCVDVLLGEFMPVRVGDAHALELLDVRVAFTLEG